MLLMLYMRHVYAMLLALLCQRYDSARRSRAGSSDGGAYVC